METTTPNRVWKVASRWSETGHPDSSILDIFRAHNIVFVGRGQKSFGKIQEGDLIAISSGLKIVALGLATSKPRAVTEFNIPFTEKDQGQFDCEEWVMGCRVSFTDLAEQDWRPCRQGTCHEVHDEADNLRRLYTELHHRFMEKREFEIQARSCTLFRNPRNPQVVLWQNNLLFRIPVYQRPYSWKEPEIRRFINDLLSAFAGAKGGQAREPMFIGTMQLGAKELLDHHERMSHKIIDGQQRLTTMILTLKLLRDQIPGDKVWAELALESRLATTVSNGTQQAYLDAALTTNTLLPFEEAQNPYLRAMRIIQGLLKEGAGDTRESQDDDARDPAPLDVRGFVEYLISQVYFVVIETRASLSKTLQIFNAINTSGMDLNGGDIFKVRYFEYLQATRKVDDQEFQRIDDLYQAVDEGNKLARYSLCNIEDILALTQHMLITRHGLPKQLHTLAASTFFDRFFDTVLPVQRWPSFSVEACRTVDLQPAEIARLIGARFDWENQIPSLGAEARCMLELIWWSRYGHYSYLIVLFRDRFQPDAATTERFIIQLSKLLIVYSIRFRRVVWNVDRLMYQVLEGICGPNPVAAANDIIVFLAQETLIQRQDFTAWLQSFEIANYPTPKNLACRLSAFLEELALADGRTAEGLRGLIFDTEIDIEHIQSWTHDDEAEHKRIHEEWKGDLDCIGNLMVLPRGLNRSIKNHDYEKEKVPYYRNHGAFRIVKDQARNYPKWNLESCRERKEREVQKLANYLCTPLPASKRNAKA